jgi:FkbM family methyltransferase
MKQTLKERGQRLLGRMGLYHRLKASRLYDLYWAVADRKVLKRRSEEVAFYRNSLAGLKPGDLIFDVGANQGFKTGVFLSLGARVVSVDPDESNQQVLRQKYCTLRLRRKPVSIVGKALSDHVGVETFFVNEPGSAKNTLNVKWVETLGSDATRFGERLGFAEQRRVETTTLEELFREHGVPFFIKIDVEGYEATVLKGLRSPVPYLSFEVNLPEFRPEALQCVALLDAIDPQAEWNFAAECADGTALRQWMKEDEFVAQLNRCTESSIEVYWKSAAGLARVRGAAAR